MRSTCWSRDSPAAHGEDQVRQAVPLQLMEVHSGADLHLQPVDAQRRL